MKQSLILTFLCPFILYAITPQREWTDKINTFNRPGLSYLVPREVSNKMTNEDQDDYLSVLKSEVKADPSKIVNRETLNSFLSSYFGVWKSKTFTVTNEVGVTVSGHTLVKGKECDLELLNEFKNINKQQLTGISDLSDYLCVALVLLTIDEATNKEYPTAYKGKTFYLVNPKTGEYLDLTINDSKNEEVGEESNLFNFAKGFLVQDGDKLFELQVGSYDEQTYVADSTIKKFYRQYSVAKIGVDGIFRQSVKIQEDGSVLLTTSEMEIDDYYNGVTFGPRVYTLNLGEEYTKIK